MVEMNTSITDVLDTLWFDALRKAAINDYDLREAGNVITSEDENIIAEDGGYIEALSDASFVISKNELESARNKLYEMAADKLNLMGSLCAQEKTGMDRTSNIEYELHSNLGYVKGIFKAIEVVEGGSNE